jgi:hypothetical protein
MPMKPITLLFGLLLLSGCASAGTAATADSPAAGGAEIVEIVEIPATADARAFTGTWHGWYDCAQGHTSLRLDLIGQEDGRVEGTFAFSEHPENPGVPSGSYRVHGTLSSGLVLRLEAGDWIEHPQDYFPVPLVGRLELERARYWGFVDFLGCETFSVLRHP